MVYQFIFPRPGPRTRQWQAASPAPQPGAAFRPLAAAGLLLITTGLLFTAVGLLFGCGCAPMAAARPAGHIAFRVDASPACLLQNAAEASSHLTAWRLRPPPAWP